MSKKYSVDIGINTKAFTQDVRTITSQVNALIQNGVQLNKEFQNVGKVNLKNQSITSLKDAVSIAESNVTKLRERLADMRASNQPASEIAKVEAQLKRAETQASRAREALRQVSPPPLSAFQNFQKGFMSGFQTADDQLTKIRASLVRITEPIRNATTNAERFGAGLGIVARGASTAASNLLKVVGSSIISGFKSLVGHGASLAREFIKMDGDVQAMNLHLSNVLKDGEEGMKKFRAQLEGLPAHQMNRVQDSAKVLGTYMTLSSDELFRLSNTMSDIQGYFALNNQQAEQLVYNFSQAQANGHLMTRDWREMGAMAPKVREEIIKLSAEKGWGINAENFSEALSNGEITGERLQEVIFSIGEKAKGAGGKINSIQQGLEAARSTFLTGFFQEMSGEMGVTGEDSAALGQKIVDLADEMGRFTAKTLVPLVKQLGDFAAEFVSINDEGKAVLSPEAEKALEDFKKVVTDIIATAAEHLPKVWGAIQKIADIVMTVAPFIVDNLGLIVGVLGALKIAGVVAPLISLAGASFKILGGGLTVAMIPLLKILIPIAALAAAAILIINNWDSISEFFSGIFSKILDVVGKAWEAIKKGVEIVGEVIKKIFSAILGFAKAYFETVGKVVGAVWNGITGAAGKMREGLGKVFGAVRDTASNIFNGIGRTIGGIFGKNTKEAEKSSQNINKSIKNISSISDSEFRKIPKEVEKSFNEAAKKVEARAKDMESAMRNVANGIPGLFRNFPTELSNIFTDAVNRAVAQLNRLVRSAQSSAKNAAAQVASISPSGAVIELTDENAITGYATNFEESIGRMYANTARSNPAVAEQKATNIYITINENQDAINKLITILRRNGIRII